MKQTVLIAFISSAGVFLLLSPVFLKLTSYLHPIVLAVVFFCLFVAVFFFAAFFRKETIIFPYRLVIGLLSLYSLALLVLLFFRPNNQSYESINLIPFSTIGFYFSGKVNGLVAFYNLAANIGLFIPYGVYLGVKKYRGMKLVLLPIFLIAAIELTQFLTGRGSLDIDDLILNVFGVYLGYFITPWFNKILIIKAA